MKYVKIYNEKMLCVGVADIEKNYDKDGYVKLFDKDMNMIGVVDVDDIPESGEDIPFVQVFDEDMNPAGIVTADNIRHSDGYLIKLQKYPDSTGAVSGGGRFIEGTEVTVVATPDSESDYSEFDGWYENGVLVSENASYTFTVEGARTLVAKFKYGNNIILYSASAKLPEISQGYQGGLHVNSFNSAITSHIFENGVGKIKFNENVTSIGNSAFSGCSGLTSITIPNSVTSIGNSAFSGCSGLTSITIPNSVTSIGSGAFNSCSGLTSATIGNSVTSIEYATFQNCSSLTSVTIPNSVTSIGSGAFNSCSGLTSATIGNSVTSIGDWAFGGCSGLTFITVESGNTNYDSRDNCNAIIETASNTLIAGCKNTTIPNSVTSIGSGAFSGCSALTSVTIPNSVTSIGNSAFSGCSGLTSATIGNSVTSIEYATFQNCSSLTSVTIPNSVTSIGDWAFGGCSNLTNVTCEATTPPTLGVYAFSNNASGRKIYVPTASVDAYKAAEGWSTYAADIEAIQP